MRLKKQHKHKLRDAIRMPKGYYAYKMFRSVKEQSQKWDYRHCRPACIPLWRDMSWYWISD